MAQPILIPGGGGGGSKDGLAYSNHRGKKWPSPISKVQAILTPSPMWFIHTVVSFIISILAPTISTLLSNYILLGTVWIPTDYETAILSLQSPVHKQYSNLVHSYPRLLVHFHPLPNTIQYNEYEPVSSYSFGQILHLPQLGIVSFILSNPYLPLHTILTPSPIWPNGIFIIDFYFVWVLSEYPVIMKLQYCHFNLLVINNILPYPFLSISPFFNKDRSVTIWPFLEYLPQYGLVSFIWSILSPTSPMLLTYFALLCIVWIPGDIGWVGLWVDECD